MVYKKYIKRGEKVYGPYLYESIKKDGKVITRYLGQGDASEPSKKSKKISKNFLVFGTVLLLAFFAVLFFASEIDLTGKAIVQIEDTYKPGETIDGSIKLSLKHGELLPASTVVLIDNAGEEKGVLLSELLSANIVNGSFYVEDKSISGKGVGIGVAGEKVISSEVNFAFRIVEAEEISGGYGGDAAEEEVTEEAVNETVEEEVVNETAEEEIEEIAEEVTEKVVEEVVEEGPEEEVAVEVTEETPEEVEEEAVDEAVEEPKESKKETKKETKEETKKEAKEESGPQSIITGEVVAELDLIEGIVSADAPYTYTLAEGEAVEIVESSQDVDLQIEDGVVTITTDYAEEEFGFGEDYLTEDIVELDIDLSLLNITAQEGVLTVSLVYDDIELVSVSETISVEAEVEEIIDETNISEIVPETNISEVNVTVVNETTENITIIINESLEDIVISEDLVINVTQYDAVVGEPVKWKKRIRVENESVEVRVDIPVQAENIVVYKLTGEIREELVEEVVEEEVANETEEVEEEEIVNETEETVEEEIRSIITAQVISSDAIEEESSGISGFFRKIFGTITGFVIGVEETPDFKIIVIDENATDFEIEYETPAPVLNETNTSYGKKITLSSEVIYENVVASTVLIKEVEESQLVLYRIVDGLKVQDNFTAYDINNNSLIDYVEWNVASLDEVIYNLYTIGTLDMVSLELLNCVVDYPIAYAIENGYPVPENFHVTVGRQKNTDVFRIGVADFVNRNFDSEYRIIQTHDLCGKAMGLFVLEDSGLTINDLEGKRITIPTNIPLDEAILTDVLENKYGLNTSNIHFMYESGVQSMERDRSDAALIVLPVYADAIKRDDVLLLADISEDYHELYESHPVRDVLVMRNDVSDEIATQVIEFMESAYEFTYDNYKKEMVETYREERGHDDSNFFEFADHRHEEYLDKVDVEGTESVQKTADTAEREEKIEDAPEIEGLVLEVNSTGGIQ